MPLMLSSCRCHGHEAALPSAQELPIGSLKASLALVGAPLLFGLIRVLHQGFRRATNGKVEKNDFKAKGTFANTINGESMTTITSGHSSLESSE